MIMYERMLEKSKQPAIEEMEAYCGDCGALFMLLNEWLSTTYHTRQELSYPYGNHYGWCIAHRVKKKLICNVFPEQNAFTVMVRLSDNQFDTILSKVQPYTKELIINKYSCGDGGWIHERVLTQEHYEDAKIVLSAKFTKVS